MAGKFDTDLVRAFGSLEAQVKNLVKGQDEDRDLANDRHRENSEKLERVDRRCAKIESTITPMDEAIKDMQPKVARNENLRGQVALAVLAVSALITGAVHLIWYAITHMSEIKSALQGLLRP